MRLWLTALLLAVIALAARGAIRSHADASVTYEDLYYLPPATALPVLSLGHDAALADLLWIRALVYIGDEFVHHGEVAHVFDYTESILALDPDFEAVYHWIASAGLYQPSEVGREEFDHTVRLLERGVSRLPDSGQMHWDLGATYAFEGSAFARDDAEADEWRLRGLEHLMVATRLGAAPPWMALSNAAMLMRVGAAERAVEHLEEMYATVTDPALRAEAEERIARIRGASHASAFADEAERSEEARLRELPYAHPDLYFIVGPRPPVDLDSTLRDGFAAHAFDDELRLDVE